MVASVSRTSGFVDLEGSKDKGLVFHADPVVGKRARRGRDAKMWRSCFGDSAWAQRLGDRSNDSLSRWRMRSLTGVAMKCCGYVEA